MWPRGWWITLINNKGVVKPPKQPARVDPAKAVDVRIDYPGGAAAEIRELVNASRLRVRRGDSARVESIWIPLLTDSVAPQTEQRMEPVGAAWARRRLGYERVSSPIKLDVVVGPR